MGKTCFVFGCKSGYRSSSDKQSMFKARNAAELSKWRIAIPRKDLKLTLKHYVCGKHFEEGDIVRGRFIGSDWYPYINPSLVNDALPTLHLGELVFNCHTNVKNIQLIHTFICC